MELAVGRLMDKSINVVKSAIQLLAAFIAHNPYSCKVTQINVIMAQIAEICLDFIISLKRVLCLPVEQCRSEETTGERDSEAQRNEGEAAGESTW